MKASQINTEKRLRRHNRIRARVSGTSERPRLAVFKSNKYISAQIIDDTKGHTLATFSSKELKKGTMSEKALETGKGIALRAKEKGVTAVVFDRGGFLYKGKIEAVATGAREGGLIF